MGIEIPRKQHLLRNCQVALSRAIQITVIHISLIMFLSAAKDIEGLRKLIGISVKLLK